MGNLLFENGHTKQSLQYYETALKFNPKELYALIGLANAYYDLNRPKDAIDYYISALKVDD
jgi:tetratricopeptide (TPR) repeat protein